MYLSEWGFSKGSVTLILFLNITVQGNIYFMGEEKMVKIYYRLHISPTSIHRNEICNRNHLLLLVLREITVLWTDDKFQVSVYEALSAELCLHLERFSYLKHWHFISQKMKHLMMFQKIFDFLSVYLCTVGFIKVMQNFGNIWLIYWHSIRIKAIKNMANYYLRPSPLSNIHR